MTIEIGGSSGGLSPVTSMETVRVVNNTLSTAIFPGAFGVTLTADVSSSTLTEVLNISGSGYFTFSALIRGTGGTVSNSKIRILIDGVEALNETSAGSFNNAHYSAQIGIYTVYSGGVSGVEGIVTFNSSFVVQIAGDGTNPVQYAYKRYLT